MRLKSICFSSLVLLGLGVAVALYGQQIRGSIVGNVTDSSGAAVPGADVTVTNQGTGIAVKTTTGTAGTYTVPNLLAGTYQISGAKQGFKTFQFSGIRLLTGQTVRQDVVLEVGAVVQTVRVSAPAQLVQTDSPTVGGTLLTRELNNLPFVTTTTDGLMNLVPGMSRGLTYGNANPSIGGNPFVGSSNFTVNGISTSNPGQGGGGNVTYVGSDEMIAQANLPSIGTLQEFKVDSSVIGAEYRSQVAVSMVTKQGTNHFHGQVYEYNENKALNANYFDFNAFNVPENPFNRNQFGGNIGGPILRDKLFFFVNYDGIREVHPLPTSINFPSAAMTHGDFSALCSKYSAGVCSDPNGTQLYNPLSGQPFLNNQIPAGMITSQAKTLVNFLPAPTLTSSPGLENESPNWYGAIPLRYGTNNEQARLDGQLGIKDSVVAFFTGSRGYPWFYGYAGPPNFGNWTDHGYNFLNFGGTETHTFSPGIVNEFRVGWVFALRHKIGQNLGFHPWELFPGLPTPASPDGGLPTINLGGYGSTNIGGAISDVGIARGRQNTVDWGDNLTIVRGRHTIKAGIEESGYKEEGVGGLTGAPPLGNFTFSGQWTGNRGWPSATYPQSPGNPFADFLLGFPVSTGYGINAQPYLLDRDWEWYAQDTWKATPRLTLNFGLRYMYQRPWTYRDHNATFFDFANNKLILAENSSTPTLPAGANEAAFAAYPFETTKQIGASLDYFRPDKNNWGPRLGFAYRPFSNNKTVLRGGWGVYYSFWADWYGLRNIQFNPPWGGANNYNTELPGNPTTPFLPDITFADPFPSSLAAGVSPNPSLSVVDRNFRSQATQQWNFTAERQIRENWSFRASYLGSQSHHLLLNGADVDRPLVQQPNVPFQDQRPLQPWSGIDYFTPAGTANFHQLQLEIQKQFSQGLSFRTEYDWSHQLQNVQYECCSPQNPLNLKGEYGNDFLQYRHRFLIYYVYELPVGRGRKWLGHSNAIVDGVLGGWRVAGITTYHSGEALDVNLEDPGTKIGWWVGRADRVAGAPLYAGRQSSSHDTGNGVPWFNTSAFAPPQPWTYGNSAPRLLFGPGFGNWDLSAMKSFGLPHGESNRLEFKADFFNLPNHYNLGDPYNCLADTRDGGAPNPTCGKIFYGVGAPRLIQLGLKLLF
jgi:Carboxypeptidase regulatory-like domain